jgi:fatty acid desaturase
MLVDAGSSKLKMPKPAWYQAIGKYAYSNLNKSLWQIIDTFVPYCVLWALMLYMVRQGYPYWTTLALAVVAGGILIRVFIFFHDCSVMAPSLRRAGQTQSWATSQVF